jgi:hypothetical protein
MSVGLPATKNEIDTRAGDLARSFQKSFDDVVTLKGYLDRTTDPELEALGYDANDIATLKTAIGDLAQLGTIWTGQAALAAPKDFRTFVSRLWGVGSF